MQYVMSLGCTVAAEWGRVGGTFTWGGLNELNLYVFVYMCWFFQYLKREISQKTVSVNEDTNVL